MDGVHCGTSRGSTANDERRAGPWSVFVSGADGGRRVLNEETSQESVADAEKVGVCADKFSFPRNRIDYFDDSVYGASALSFWRDTVEVWNDGYFDGHSHTTNFMTLRIHIGQRKTM